jgi:peptidoglycan-associated lipoprotein
MRTLSITVALTLAVPLVATGCKKASQTPETTASTSRDRPRPAPTTAAAAPRQERAQGEVRTALLELQRVHFAYDAATLLPAAREALARAADGLAAHPDVHIHVEGHTDARGTDEYNLALGDRRARAVIDYLVALGVDRARLHPVSLGEERPARDRDDAMAWAENRRAEFRLMRGDVELVLQPGTAFDDAGDPVAHRGQP